MLSFALAAAHPELVATAIPVSGIPAPALWPAERPKTRPLPKIIALHGEADKLISVDLGATGRSRRCAATAYDVDASSPGRASRTRCSPRHAFAADDVGRRRRRSDRACRSRARKAANRAAVATSSGEGDTTRTRCPAPPTLQLRPSRIVAPCTLSDRADRCSVPDRAG